MVESSFRAGGLATGLDTNAIIDQLTQIQRAPILAIEKRQEAFSIQLSGLGRLRSALEAMKSASTKLATGGVLGVSTSEGMAGFKAKAVSGAPVGTFDIQVTNLARAAKARSSSFADSNAQVAGGTLSISANGVVTDVAITDGATLADVAFTINQSGAAVTASVVNTGTSSYLTFTSKETGYPIGGAPGDALSITETTTGSTGAPLGMTITQAAENATVIVDGLSVERRTNTLTDVIDDVTLTLTAETSAAESLVVQRDIDQTEAAVTEFVTAYNAVMAIVQGDLNFAANTDRQKTLGADPSLRNLQVSLRNLLTTEVTSAGTDVRTLVDIGVKSARDGTLSVDRATLEEALARSETGFASVFAGVGGIGEQVERIVELQTDSEDGALSIREEGIDQRIEAGRKQIENLELRVEAFRQGLIARFTAMEELVSSLKSMGNFLEQVKFPGFGGGDDS